MYQRTWQMHRWLSWLLVIGLLGGILPSLHAQNTEDKASVSPTDSAGQALLADAIRLYEEFEWDSAAKKLQNALPILQSTQDYANLAEAYWYLAVISRAQGNLDEARKHMVEVIRFNADFALPQTLQGTDFEVLLKDALAQADRTPPQISFVSGRETTVSLPLRIVVEVQDNSPIERVEIRYQPINGSEVGLTDVRQEADNRWVGVIPAKGAEQASELTVRVSALDSWMNAHTESTRIRLAKKGGGHGMLYVVGAAVAAVGGTIAALVLGGGGEEPDKPPDDGTPDGSTNGDTWPQSSPPGPPQ